MNMTAKLYIKENFTEALSHRDYYEQGASIMIEMFDDRVEISNPEGLLPVVAKDFGHKSMTRNPLIFGLFTRMHLVERVASGIPRMQEAMREANLPEPEFHTEGMFTVVFKRQITNSANYDTVNGRVNDIVNDTINENEQAILNLLATIPGLNASEISKYINKSLRTTMRYIKTLQDKDLIEFRGVPKIGGVLFNKTIKTNFMTIWIH